tara:strand:+ start:999 stop:1553 length:555 start_codon:yes stop_codon:yes gene_type:complete
MSDIKQMMVEDSKDFLDDFDSEDISQNCVQLKKLEDAILQKEEELKTLKAKADRISSRVIPELMQEQGLSQLKLADGSAVTVAKTYNCTINKEQIESAYHWLRDNELGDIIKNEVAVSFGVGEDNKAQRLLDLAAENGYQPTTKTKVEPSVLRALYRERIESGLDMPSDLFNLFIKDRTKITRK